MSEFDFPALGDASAPYQTRENLVTAVRAAIDARGDALQSSIDAISGGVLVVGEWAASSGAFPTTRPGGAAIQVGDAFVVTAAGTVDGVTFGVADRLIAIAATGGATYAGKWVTASYSDILSALGTGLVTPTDGTVADTLSDVVALNVRHFASASAMAAAVGYVRFPRGNTAIAASVTLDVPLYFDPGAYVTVATGQTMTIRGQINSSRQHIFRGAGLIQLRHTYPGQGELSRYAQPEWFGAMPGVSDGDVGPALQRMTTAAGTDRELYADFGVGTYWIASAVTWQRASRVVGAGDRLTNIVVRGAIADGGNVFLTGGVGCRFENLQFTDADGVPRTSGAYINIAHSRCKVINCECSNFFIAVRIADGGTECEVSGFLGLLSADGAVSSRLISIQESDCYVNNIKFQNTLDYAPQAIVAVDLVARNVSDIRIANVFGQTSGIAVLVAGSSSYAVSDIFISNVDMDECSEIVAVVHSGEFVAPNITIEGARSRSTLVNGVRVQVTSSGEIRNLSISGVKSIGGSGHGVILTASGSATIRRITLNDYHCEMTAGGVDFGGTGQALNDAQIGPGICRGCGVGFAFKVAGLSASGLHSAANTTGYFVRSGTTTWRVSGLSRGNATPFTDDSGSVTKSNEVLVGA